MIRRLDPRDNVEYHIICDATAWGAVAGTSVAGGYMSVSPMAGTKFFRALSKSNAAAATIQGDSVRLSSSLSRELFIKCKWTRREKAS